LTFKLYIKKFLIVSMVSILTVVLFNLYQNEFGLFGDSNGKNIRIYANQKTSKYLFSFNYIPDNFDGILVGASYSNQMIDTQKLSNHYDIYNLSMDGANISELKVAIDNTIKYGDIKLFIICLSPYITKNNGIKSSQINPKEYYSSLGSISNFKYYYKKYIDLEQGDKSEYYDSYWGYINNEQALKNTDSTMEIDDYISDLKKTTGFKIHVDNIAYNELSQTLSNIRNKGIQVIAYYHPFPKRLFNVKAYRESYAGYKDKIDKLLDFKDDVVIDFNQTKYNYIRGYDDSYSDAGHLSKLGANKIINVLKTHIGNLD